jgi:hypothetical protein
MRLQNNFESIVYYCGVRGWKHRKNMRSTAPVFFLASTVLMMIMAKINFVLAHPKIRTKYRKHWKSYASFQPSGQIGSVFGTTENFCSFAKVCFHGQKKKYRIRVSAHLSVSTKNLKIIKVRKRSISALRCSFLVENRLKHSQLNVFEKEELSCFLYLIQIFGPTRLPI